MNKNKTQKAQRVRTKGKKISQRPRLSVHLSLKYLSAQVINDRSGKTVAAVHEKQFLSEKDKTTRYQKMAQELAKQAKAGKIKQVWFDRGHRSYHGRLANFADLIRKADIEF